MLKVKGQSQSQGHKPVLLRVEPHTDGSQTFLFKAQMEIAAY